MRLVSGLLLLLSLLCIALALQWAIPTSAVDMQQITKSHSQTLRQIETMKTMRDTTIVYQDSNSLPLHVVKALYYLYLQVKEQPKASNKGKFIDTWNKDFGLKAVPWCATGQSNWNRDGLVKYPKIHSAMAKSFATKNSYGINDIMFNNYIPKAGDYRVKTRRGGNHVDVVIAYNPKTKSGFLLGGNVGDKITIREFTVKSLIADGTTHITSVKGNYNYYLTDNDFKEWLKKFGTVRQKITIIKQPLIIDSITVSGTWYDLHGRKTASGARFNRTKLTAAYNKVPLGTRAIAQYKNRRVTVTINDRVPNKNIIDLSPAACDSLRFKSGKIKLYILGK